MGGNVGEGETVTLGEARWRKRMRVAKSEGGEARGWVIRRRVRVESNVGGGGGGGEREARRQGLVEGLGRK